MHLPSNMLIALNLFHQEQDSELTQSMRIFLSHISTHPRAPQRTLSIISGLDDPSVEESQAFCHLFGNYSMHSCPSIMYGGYAWTQQHGLLLFRTTMLRSQTTDTATNPELSKQYHSLSGSKCQPVAVIVLDPGHHGRGTVLSLLPKKKNVFQIWVYSHCLSCFCQQHYP